MLVVQIVSGVVLAMHYVPHETHGLRQRRAHHARRELRLAAALHALERRVDVLHRRLYPHLPRLYYGSYKAPREVLWLLGIVIYLLMMATGFLGYTLPWGQMSFWGATVITNFFSAIPVIGLSDHAMAVGLVRGRQRDAAAVLQLALSAAVRDRGRRGAAHLGAARAGQQQSARHRREGAGRTRCRSIPTTRRRTGSRSSCSCCSSAISSSSIPNVLGHTDNYIPANRLVTPPHIVPEWYYLPLYAILRSVPDKLIGVILMFGAIFVWALLAVARYVARAVGEVPSDLPPVVLHLDAS